MRTNRDKNGAHILLYEMTRDNFKLTSKLKIKLCNHKTKSYFFLNIIHMINMESTNRDRHI